MTDIDTLAATIRAGLNAEAEEAQCIPDGNWWTEELGSRFWGDVQDARVACSQGTVAILPDYEGGHLSAPHIARQDPATTLRRVASQREMVDLLLAEEHLPSCPVDGSGYWPCDCGRDARVTAYLTLLAGPYVAAVPGA